MDFDPQSPLKLLDAARDVWASTPHLQLTHADFGAFAQSYMQRLRDVTTTLTDVNKDSKREADSMRALALSRLSLIRNPFANGNRADSIERKGNRLVMWIYGGIGGEGLLADDICKALDDHRDAAGVVVRIASAGGYVDETLRIAESLMAHPGRSIAIIDRYAYSGASAIASAAHRVLIRRNASWMAHPGWVVVGGDADRLVREAALMRGNDIRVAGLYSRRRRINAADVHGLIASRKYLSADQAVAAGVCDAVIHELPIAWDQPTEQTP